MNEKKKTDELQTNMVCSPPSHPTSLGNVWVGETRPAPGTIADLQKLGGSEQPRKK